MPQTNFKVIERKLEKKTVELVEVKGLRQKLFEKEISAEIEKLKNQKIELIFQCVKKEMKNEKLEITSESINTLPEVLRNSTLTTEDGETDNESISMADKEIENDVSKENETEILDSRSNSIFEITQK